MNAAWPGCAMRLIMRSAPRVDAAESQMPLNIER